MENNQEVGRQLKLIDFENIHNNDWFVVNQFEIQGDQRLRRPDVLVFVNGLAKAPSATHPTTGNFVVRDYQIIAYSTYSVVQFQTGYPDGTNVIVLYNTVLNQ